MKDLFSSGSAQYAKFRPVYPKELFDWIISLVPEYNRAWDCGTGNGQVAVELAEYFREVYATDISEQQIQQAFPKENIIYRVESAENASFPDQYFDLITVAQAIHWFDFDAFYTEVKRTLKPAGIIAVIAYGLVRSDEKTNAVIDTLYSEILSAYWDAERKYIDENYSTISFPFTEIPSPAFSMRYQWTWEHFTGYLNTWSAVKHYTEKNNQNPVEMILPELQNAWGKDTVKEFEFPVLLRTGKMYA